VSWEERHLTLVEKVSLEVEKEQVAMYKRLEIGERRGKTQVALRIYIIYGL
jgi:hypothetical protein